MNTLKPSLRAIFVKAVLNDWTEAELMTLFPDNRVGEVKDEMIKIYNEDISATTLEQQYREFLDGITITMKIHLRSNKGE